MEQLATLLETRSLNRLHYTPLIIIGWIPELAICYKSVVDAIIDRIQTRHPSISTSGIRDVRDAHLKAIDVVYATLENQIDTTRSTWALHVISPATSTLICSQFNEIEAELDRVTSIVSSLTEPRDDSYVRDTRERVHSREVLGAIAPFYPNPSWVTRTSMISIWISAHQLITTLQRVYAYTCGTRAQWAVAKRLHGLSSYPISELAKKMQPLFKPDTKIGVVLDIIHYLQMRWNVDGLENMEDTIVGGSDSNGKELAEMVLVYMDEYGRTQPTPSKNV